MQGAGDINEDKFENATNSISGSFSAVNAGVTVSYLASRHDSEVCSCGIFLILCLFLNVFCSLVNRVCQTFLYLYPIYTRILLRGIPSHIDINVETTSLI